MGEVIRKREKSVKRGEGDKEVWSGKTVEMRELGAWPSRGGEEGWEKFSARSKCLRIAIRPAKGEGVVNGAQALSVGETGDPERVLVWGVPRAVIGGRGPRRSSGHLGWTRFTR